MEIFVCDEEEFFGCINLVFCYLEHIVLHLLPFEIDIF